MLVQPPSHSVSKTFSSPPKAPPYPPEPLPLLFPSKPLQPSSPTDLLIRPVSRNFRVVDIPQKWNHSECGLLHLASYTLYVFKIHLYTLALFHSFFFFLLNSIPFCCVCPFFLRVSVLLLSCDIDACIFVL